MPDIVDVALLGFGDVGQALARRIAEGGTGERLTAVSDTSGTIVDRKGLDPQALVEAKQASGAVTDAPGGSRSWRAGEAAGRVEADVVVQLTPSKLTDPDASLAAIEAALADGKHVVTAAKDALACRPERVRALQREHGRRVRASASVGASVPVLETLDAGFSGDDVQQVRAILNGSTTFVLSEMEQGTPREEALAKAREQGLLEADPTVDLTGQDAAAKAAILHQHVFDSSLSLDDVDVTGIGHLDGSACRSARRKGFSIRLVAHVDEDGARVAPVEIDDESPLAIDGPACCVQLSLAGAGEIELSGPGAGPTETASAVLGDVIALAEARNRPRVAAV